VTKPPPDFSFASDRPDGIALETRLSEGRTAKYWFEGEGVRIEFWRGAQRLNHIEVSRADWFVFMDTMRQYDIDRDVAALAVLGVSNDKARKVVMLERAELQADVVATLKRADPTMGGTGQAVGRHVAVTSRAADNEISGAMRFHRRAAEDLRQLTEAAQAVGATDKLLGVVDGERPLRAVLARDYFRLLKPVPVLTPVVPDYVRVRSQIRAGNARRLVVGTMRALRLSEYQRQDAVQWLARGMSEAA
jgi:hypothetical protein